MKHNEEQYILEWPKIHVSPTVVNHLHVRKYGLSKFFVKVEDFNKRVAVL